MFKRFTGWTLMCTSTVGTEMRPEVVKRGERAKTSGMEGADTE